jgi:nickel-dependent lactate racemase
MGIERQNEDGFISAEQMREVVGEFFAKQDCSGERILVIAPDNTRSGPVGDVFKAIFDCIGDKVKRLDVLIALGTHQPISEEQICVRLGMTETERRGKYKSVRFFNHQWDKPETFKTIGEIPASEIEKLTGGLFSEKVNVAINKMIFDYDEFFILGPVFPHEVVGFSGGHKYIFPGIAGAEIINFFHWLGAVVTNPAINGNKWTVTRAVVEKAAAFIKVPHELFAIVAVKADSTPSTSSGQASSPQDELKGIFIGDCLEAWEKAADLSAKVHIVYKDKPFKTVLGIAPTMYDDIWTAGKVMYKLEPVVADGGMLIIYAPHIKVISWTHGAMIEKLGYHTRDYFLKQWDKFKSFPGGAMAHCTHVKGIGTFVNGVEKPRVNVVLATGIGREQCKKVNLGYMDPEQIEIDNYQGKEDKGILVVHHAGETLYRLSDGTVPRIND